MPEQAKIPYAQDQRTRIMGLVDGYMPPTPPKPVALVTTVQIATPPPPPADDEKVVAGKNVFIEGMTQMPTSQPVATVVKSIHDASEGAKSWREKRGILSFTEAVNDGKSDISVVIKNQEPAERLLDILERLDDLAVDVYIAAITHWLHNAKAATEAVWIHVDQILQYRGIKPRIQHGYTAGYREEERTAIAERFELLDRMYLYLQRLTVYSPKKRREITVESKVLGITDRMVENEKVIAVKVWPGEYGKLLYGSDTRQTGLMFQKIIEYDYYHQSWEKRIALYLTFQWAIRKAHGTLNQPFRISTILQNIHKGLNVRYPKKTLAKFEKALNTLNADGLIQDWRYDAPDKLDTDKRDWILDWCNQTITVVVPQIIEVRYRTVQENRLKILNKRN